jgi:hypothetical protein
MDIFGCIFYLSKNLLPGCEAVHTAYSLYKADGPYEIGIC